MAARRLFTTPRRAGAVFHRTPEGVARVRASAWEDAFHGLGWIHGRDRGGQIALLRLLGQGRLCETLRDDESLLALDVHFRRLGLARDAADHAGGLPSPYSSYVDAYCHGVTQAWEEHPPWPLRLARYRPEPLLPADVLLILKLASFVGLAEIQRAGELFVIEAIRRGADPQSLRALLPALGAVDPHLLQALQGVPSLVEGSGASASAGSNAWAVAGPLSRSGRPILCCDPHLEVGWLPPLGYEAELAAGHDWVKGLTLAGLPGFLVGRTERIAWGVTYTCADTSDYFVERCREGRYLRDGQWYPFRERRESVFRKRHPPREFTVYESDHGLLEGDPTREGLYLSWNWTGFGAAGLGSLQGFTDLVGCETVPEAQAAARKVDIPTLHFAFADREGNIGYQFAGALPRRPDGWSGLAPTVGWESARGWRGLLDPSRDFPSELNPSGGRVVTANEARRVSGGPVLSTLPMAPYRRRRIHELLSSGSNFDVATMRAFQYDLVSLEARELLPHYLAHVPSGRLRQILESWDHRYTAESLAASLFENIHRAATKELLGRVLGRNWVEALFEETSLSLVLLGGMAALLARPDSPWMPAEERGDALRQGVETGLREPAEPWGRRQKALFRNAFFGGKIGRLLGLHRGPYPLPGCHATVRAGVVLRAWGRPVTVAPAYHFIADLSSDEAWSNLPGGPKEAALNRWYAVGLRPWFEGRYKRI